MLNSSIAKQFFALLVMFVLVSFTQGQCPAGTIRTNLDGGNLDTRGQARLNPVSICWNSGAGSLWFRRQAYIANRFEVHFTVDIDDKYCGWLDNAWNPTWWMDGFTFILSRDNTNYLNGDGRFLGYEGIPNAVVTEFDLSQDIFNGDNKPNALAYHKCIGSRCSTRENGTQQYDLPFRYATCVRNIYNVDITFDQKTTSIETKVNGRVIASTQVNSNDFNKRAYLGFTGAFTGDKRDLRFYNAYICEDDYSRFELSAAKGGKTVTEKCGSSVGIVVKSFNNRGEQVTSDANFVRNYSLRASSTCGTASNPVVSGDGFYFEITGCTTAGNHTVTLYSAKGENAEKFTFTTTARGFEQVQVTDKTITDNGKVLIKAGRQGGDYIASDYHGYVPIAVRTADAFGNIFDLGSDPSAICSSLGVYSNYPSTRMGKIVCQGSNGSYSVLVPIEESGSYKLTFNLPSPTIYNFELKFGAPSVEKSIFSLKGAAKSPRAIIGTTINSACNLFDSLGNKLNGNDVINVHQGRFSCKVTSVNINGKSTEIDGTVVATDSGFDCSYKVAEAGTSSISATLTLKNGAPQSIPASLASVVATFTPTDIKNIKYYDPVKTSFYKYNSGNNELQTPDSDTITMIDFLHADGTSCGKESGKYISDDFKCESIKASLYAEDSADYQGDVAVEAAVSNGVRYCAVKLRSAGYFKKSSRRFFLDLSLNGTTVQLAYRYPLGNTNGFSVSIMPLNVDYTEFVPLQNLPKITMNAGTDVKIGDVITYTEDSCLYNYWVEEKRFDSNVKGLYYKRTDVEGFYEVHINTRESKQYFVSGTLDDYDFIGGYEVVVQAEPLVSIFKADTKLNRFLDEKANTIENQSNDQNVIYYFHGFDAAENELDINPMRYNQFVGLAADVVINGVSNVCKFERSKTSNISYDRNKGSYVFWDYFKIAGDYVVKMTGKNGASFVLKYHKTPGLTDLASSSANVVSDPEIVFGKTATVALNMNDKWGSGIESDAAFAAEELKKVKVQALSKDRAIIVNFKYVKTEGVNFIFESEPIKKATEFDLQATYSERPIPCKQRCGYKVRFGDIFLNNTQTSIILSNTIPISVAASTQVANTKDVPLFTSIFYDEDRNFIEVIDPAKEQFTVSITGKKFEIQLNTEWINSNELRSTIKPENYETLKDAVSTTPYNLNFSYKNKVLSYPLKFLGDGKDQDAGNGDMDISKTVVDQTEVTSVAGQTVEVRIELRTEDNLRVNHKNELTIFTAKNKESEPSFTYAFNYGNKKGVYLFSFTSNRRTNPRFNELTILINGKEVPTRIKHIVHCSALHKVVVNDKSISDKKNNVLVQGRVTDPIDVTMTAYDVYENLFDVIFDPVPYSLERIANLFSYDHSEGENVYVTASTDPVNSTFALSVKTRRTGVVKITSRYLDGAYTSTFLPGPVSSAKSYVNVEKANIGAGDKVVAEIFHKDIYGNTIPTEKMKEEEFKDFISIAISTKPREETVTLKEEIRDPIKSAIVASRQLTVAGNSQVKADYQGENINCFNCNLLVAIGDVEFKNSAVNRIISEKPFPVSAGEKALNSITTDQRPIWRMNLYDAFKNKYDNIPTNLSFRAKFYGPLITIDLCSQNVADYVEVTVCPEAKNLSHWRQLISKKDYKFDIEMIDTTKPTLQGPVISHNYEITGGDSEKDASNGDMDITKTWFSTDRIDTVAGRTETFLIEIRTAEGKRRSYFYEDTEKQVVPSFELDNGEANYKVEVEQGGKPGQYSIKVKSTKTYLENSNNQISFTIEGQKCTSRTIKYVVRPAKPVKGEILDSKDKKIEVLPEGDTDTTYKFNVQLYDEFNNKAIIETDEYNYYIKNPADARKTSNIVKNADGSSFRIQFNPREAGVWNFFSDLIASTPFDFRIYPGAISALNTKVIAPTTLTAGEDVTVSVMLFDTSGNLRQPQDYVENPISLMYKYSTGPVTFSSYITPEIPSKLGFIKSDIKHFNRKSDAKKQFVISNNEVQVFIKTNNDLCVTSTKEGLVSVESKTGKCDIVYTLKSCNNGFHLIQLAADSCLEESTQGIVAGKCDCNNSPSNFKIERFLSSTKYHIQTKVTNLAWTEEADMHITKELVQGAPNQKYTIEYSNDVKSRFEGANQDGYVPVIQYTFPVTVAANYVFRAINLNNNDECKCENCLMTVNPDKESFPNYVYQRFGTSQKFVAMEDSFSEDNTRTVPLFRLFPADRFNNIIPKIDRKLYEMTLTDSKNNKYVLKVSDNKDERFVEFTANDDKSINDDKYENLVAGDYTLETRARLFGNTPNLRKVSLKGTAEDSDSSNSELDIQGTILRESNLSVKAMQQGYLLIKLVNKDGARRNEWGHKIHTTSSLEGDKFEYKVQNGGKKGTYIINFTTDKSNNFPAPGFRNTISIFVNDVEVTALKPELDVSPEAMFQCDIHNENKQDADNLRQGTADTPLNFKVVCTDAYLNIATCVTETLGVVVKDASNSEIETSVARNRLNGEAVYTSLTKKSGVYNIDAARKFFKKGYKYNNKAGILVAENISFVNNAKTIIAGSQSSLTIRSFDQYMNIIDPTIVQHRYLCDSVSPSRKTVPAVKETVGDAIVFKVLSTEKGVNQFLPSLDGKIRDCSDCSTTVIPGRAKLENTKFSTSNLGTDSGDGHVTKSNKYVSAVEVRFADAYNNIIDNLEKDYGVKDFQVVGNNSREIVLDVSQVKGSNYFLAEIKGYKAVRRWAATIGMDGYMGSCNVFDGAKSFAFKYPVAIQSWRDDTGRGNGDFVAANTVLSAEKLAFTAGSSASFDITLMTSEKKIFNDGVEIPKTFKVTTKYEDKNFSYNITKKGAATGIYTCTVTTTSILAQNQIITVSVKEEEKDAFVDLKNLAIDVLVTPKLPPNTDKTVFSERPGATQDASKPVVFKFQLVDNFGNTIINNPGLCNSIVLTNFGAAIESVTVLHSDQKTYITTAKVAYPPRLAKLQLRYRNFEYDTEIHNEAFQVFLESLPDYSQSKINCSNCKKLKAGEAIDASLVLYDGSGVCVDTEKDIVVKCEISKANSKSITYNFKKMKNPNSASCINYYAIQVPEDQKITATGSYNIKCSIDSSFNKEYVLEVINGEISTSGFRVKNTSQGVDFKKLPAGTEFKHVIEASDRFGNQVFTPLSEQLKFRIVGRGDNTIDENGYSIMAVENKAGSVEITASIRKTGSFYLGVSYNGADLSQLDLTNAPATYEVVAQACSGERTNYDLKGIENVFAGQEASFVITCFDKFGNQLTKGGDKISFVVDMGGEIAKSSVYDNADGTYNLKFSVPKEGAYVTSISVGANVIYGNNAKTFKFTNPVCADATPIRCPADPTKCVAQTKDCAGKNDCATETPFFCDVKGETVCVKSNNECDCPKGLEKDDVFGFCSAEKNTRHAKIDKAKITCAKEGSVVCDDGSCRTNLNQCPSRYVCPIGQVQCPNLSCVNNLNECGKSVVCGNNQVRCPDQSCAENRAKCPTLITCSSREQVVCPNRSCGASELDCLPTPQCRGENPFACHDGTCVKDLSVCAKSVVCGEGQALDTSGKCLEIVNNAAVKDEQLTADEIARKIKSDYQIQEQIRKAEEARKIAEEEARKIAEEIARKAKELAEKLAEEARKVAEEVARKLKQAAEQAQKEKDEKARKEKEAEIARQKAIEEARLKAEEEARQRAILKAQQEEQARREAAARLQCTNDKNWMSSNIFRNVPFYTNPGTIVRHGGSIKLLHWITKNVLHSHGNRYPNGSRQQEVTCYWSRDNNDWFTINSDTGRIGHGSIVNFRHNLTGNSVFMDRGFTVPLTGQYEVSARPFNGDTGFKFEVQIHRSYGCDANQLVVGDLIKLKNVRWGNPLHSHPVNMNYGTSQQQVTGFPSWDDNDFWIVIEVN